MNINLDGWANVLTGMGIKGRDKQATTRMQMFTGLNQMELDSIYRGDGFGRRIIDGPAETMTRAWIDLEIETPGEDDSPQAERLEKHVLSRLDELNAKPAITDLIRWSNLYGGGVVLMGVNDRAADLAQPVNESTIDDMIYLRTLDRWEVSYSMTDLYNDPMMPKYGQPQFYQISPVGGTTHRVHESRVLRMDGDPLPNREKSSNNYWGASIFESVYPALRDLATVYAGSTQTVHEFTIAMLRIKNLADMIGSGNEAEVMRRLQIIDLAKGMMNTVLLDESEEFSRDTATITGLPDLIDKMVTRLAAVTGIPVPILMGESPAGLNATGATDLRNYYDMISAKQNDKLRPVLNKLVRYLLLSRRAPGGGKEPQDWYIKFEPLWQMDEKQAAEVEKLEAETEKLKAETEDIYIANQVLDPEEVRVKHGWDAR